MEVLASAIRTVHKMGPEETGRSIETVGARQPNLLLSVLAVEKLGVSRENTEFLLKLLLVAFEAMRQSPYDWEVISEDEQERHLQRIVGNAKLSEGLDPESQSRLTQKMIEAQPEQPLYAFVTNELIQWRRHLVHPQESDKFVDMCALSLVECIAHGKAAQVRSSTDD